MRAAAHWDPETHMRARQFWPRTTAMLAALAPLLYEVETSMDFALSGDVSVESVSDEKMAARLLGGPGLILPTRAQYETLFHAVEAVLKEHCVGPVTIPLVADLLHAAGIDSPPRSP